MYILGGTLMTFLSVMVTRNPLGNNYPVMCTPYGWMGRIPSCLILESLNISLTGFHGDYMDRCRADVAIILPQVSFSERS